MFSLLPMWLAISYPISSSALEILKNLTRRNEKSGSRTTRTRIVAERLPKKFEPRTTII